MPYKHTCEHIHVHVYIYICIYMYIYTYIYVNINIYIYVYIYFMYVYIYVYVYIYIYMYIYLHVYICVSKYKYIYIYTHSHGLMYVTILACMWKNHIVFLQSPRETSKHKWNPMPYEQWWNSSVIHLHWLIDRRSYMGSYSSPIKINRAGSITPYIWSSINHHFLFVSPFLMVSPLHPPYVLV